MRRRLRRQSTAKQAPVIVLSQGLRTAVQVAVPFLSQSEVGQRLRPAKEMEGWKTSKRWLQQREKQRVLVGGQRPVQHSSSLCASWTERRPVRYPGRKASESGRPRVWAYPQQAASMESRPRISPLDDKHSKGHTCPEASHVFCSETGSQGRMNRQPKKTSDL